MMGTMTRIMSFHFFPNVTIHLRTVINKYNLIDEYKGIFNSLYNISFDFNQDFIYIRDFIDFSNFIENIIFIL